MPRKTKEINEETTIKKQTKSRKKIDVPVENVIDAQEKVVAEKKATKTRAKSASSTKSKVSTTAKAKKETKTTKAKSDKTASAKKETKTTTKSKAKTATPKKSTKAKSSEKDKEEKATKKAAKSEKKTSSKSADKDAKTSKKATAKKASTTKTAAKKTTKTAAKTTKVKTSTKAKSTKVKSTKVASPSIVEYYDLPYKYNQTIVKVLYQNPTTLFVYWEISDNDIENYKKQYGENFFETTKPVLVVYNDTMNYHFEVEINDFANSWYFNINDSKCDYRVELTRRPIYYNENIKTDKIHITSSNKIESPNDRILFSTDEPYTVYFRNTKNNIQRKVNLPKLLESLELANKNFGFPIIKNIQDLYKNIYNVDDVEEFSIDLNTPSSGNPSSHSLSSRFM